MTAATARTVTTSVRRALRSAGLLDAVVKTGTRQDGDTWVTNVETVTKDQAAVVADDLRATFPAVEVRGGMNFFEVRITQPVATPEPAPVVEEQPAAKPVKRWKSRDEIQAERDSLDMEQVNELVDFLFTAWRGHRLTSAAKAVRLEHARDQVLLEWVDHYLSERIGSVSPVYLAPIPGTRNYLLDKVYA
jgi:hypothetical protein